MQGSITTTHFPQVKLNLIMLDENMLHAYITCELGDFSSILKLWSLTEIDAVTFGVLQVLLILHLLENIYNCRSCFATFFISKPPFLLLNSPS